MKIIVEEKNTLVIKLKSNEEVITSISELCKKKKICAGHFTIIGAASEVTVSFYNLKTKTYQDKIYSGDVEILNITGNISVLDDTIKIHAHGSFANEDYSVFGGHVQNCIISATGEVHLTIAGRGMFRKFDKETGLFLLSDKKRAT